MTESENLEEFTNRVQTLCKYIENAIEKDDDRHVQNCSMSAVLSKLICESDAPFVEFFQIIGGISETLKNAIIREEEKNQGKNE
jgi:hypothetical protein